MAKATKHLKEYGFTIDDEQDGLVRMKRGRVYDKFVEVEGGWHYFLAGDDGWEQRLHHIEDGKPVMLWPDDEVAKIYRVAVEQRKERE